LLGRVFQEVVVVILIRGLLVLDLRHVLEMIEVVPDLLAAENIADLGDKTWQFPSELGPRR
jgi:hypothetical protein